MVVRVGMVVVVCGGRAAGRSTTHFYEKGERQLGAFFAAAFDSAQSAAFDSVCGSTFLCSDLPLEWIGVTHGNQATPIKFKPNQHEQPSKQRGRQSSPS